MLSEKRIRAIVKDELKEQIRKQTIRMRVLASCNRVAERFGNPTDDSYYSKSEEIKEAIDKELKYVGKVYGIEIKPVIMRGNAERRRQFLWIYTIIHHMR